MSNTFTKGIYSYNSGHVMEESKLVRSTLRKFNLQNPTACSDQEWSVEDSVEVLFVKQL